MPEFRPESDVLRHRQVGEQRRPLEDEVHGPLVCRPVGDVVAEDADAALVRDLEAGDDSQHGGFAAAARSEKRHELAVGYSEVERVNGYLGRVLLRDALQLDREPARILPDPLEALLRRDWVHRIRLQTDHE